MEEPRIVVLWIDSENDSFKGKVANSVKDKNTLLFVKNPNDSLSRLKFDNPEIDAIVMDLYFDGDESSEIGINLLQKIREMDPDIPIFVLTNRASNKEYYEAGKEKAKILNIKDSIISTKKSIQSYLRDINSTVKLAPTYDRKQRELANNVAADYLKMETARPGTIAYWLFEEDIIGKLVLARETDRKNQILNVIDIGCGTGRYGRVITENSKSARVTCVDFSGKMLAQAQDLLPEERCRFQRSLAEQLPKDYSDFDIAILGFGFPSYSPTRRVLREAHRILSNDGWLFVSVYNHSALAYEQWKGLDGETQRPISTWIDRDAGEITIPARNVTKIAARTFTPPQFARELRQAGFQIGGYLTFPVLYSTLRCSDIANFALVEQNAGEAVRVNPYPHSGFSYELWDIDQKLSHNLQDKGFYTVFLASQNKVDIETVAKSLGFHVADTLKP